MNALTESVHGDAAAPREQTHHHAHAHAPLFPAVVHEKKMHVWVWV